jgi:nucleoside-diphosphate-sugar epimerase
MNEEKRRKGARAMKVLLTGAFGNIGRSTMDELLKRGHQVRCFDIRTRANRENARQYGKKSRHVFWGDLRQPEDVGGSYDQDVSACWFCHPEIIGDGNWQ